MARKKARRQTQQQNTGGMIANGLQQQTGTVRGSATGATRKRGRKNARRGNTNRGSNVGAMAGSGGGNTGTGAQFALAGEIATMCLRAVQAGVTPKQIIALVEAL